MNGLLVAVDPGIQGTGVAIWKGRDNVPIGTAILTPKVGLCFEDRLRELMGMFSACVHSYIEEEVTERLLLCEYPRYMRSVVGEASAGGGDLVKLTCAATIVMAVGFMWRFECRFVPVNHWKGTLPKSIVEKRVVQTLGKSATKHYKSHVYDAVGIGLHHRGLINV